MCCPRCNAKPPTKWTRCSRSWARRSYFGPTIEARSRLEPNDHTRLSDSHSRTVNQNVPGSSPGRGALIRQAKAPIPKGIGAFFASSFVRHCPESFAEVRCNLCQTCVKTLRRRDYASRRCLPRSKGSQPRQGPEPDGRVTDEASTNSGYPAAEEEPNLFLVDPHHLSVPWWCGDGLLCEQER